MHPLVERLNSLKERAQRHIFGRAVLCTLAVCLGGALAMAWFDRLLRAEDAGTRWVLTFGWLLISAAAIRHWMLPILRADLDITTLARLVERRYPQLGNQLSSSVAFLSVDSDTPEYGSQAMMRNVVAKSIADMEPLDLSSALDPLPLRRSMLLFAGVALFILLALVASPAESTLAMRRLMLPWRDLPWPRQHHLEFVNMPERIAKGTDLVFTVQDANDASPRLVEMQLSDWTGGALRESWSMAPDEDRWTWERKNVTRAFRYRAVGGDHTNMPWQQMEVVDPPRLQQAHATLVFPAYTGWLPRTIDAMPTALRVLTGTQIDLQGAADRQLSGAEITWSHQDETTTYLETFEPSRNEFHVPKDGETWTVDGSGQYQLVLHGDDGTRTVNEDRWPILAIPDQPPVVRWKELLPDRWVSAKAVVPLCVDVEDDLRIRRVSLHYSRSDQSDVGEVVVVIDEGQEVAPEGESPSDWRLIIDRKEVRHPWSLDEFGLPRGAELSFYVSAEDYHGQITQSPRQSLVVISEQELIDRVSRRHSVVLARLQRQLEQQRKAHELLTESQLQLLEANEIAKATMDRLQSAMLLQRQVNSEFVGPGAATMEELKNLKGLLDRSQMDASKTQQTLDQTLQALRDLGQSEMQPALESATQAQQMLQASLDVDRTSVPAESVQELASSGQHQAEVIRRLEEMLDAMSSWDNYRRVAQDLRELQRQQADLQAETQGLSRELLSRASEDLDGEQRGALRSLASRQLDLARRTERSLDNLSRVRERLQEDPSTGQILDDAMELADELAVAGRMRQAGRMIGQSRLGTATQEQADAEQAIDQMLDSLQQRAYSAEERKERMEASVRELKRLRREQSTLTDETEKAASEADRRKLQRLTRRQQEQAEAMQKLDRQLQRLQAREASQSMQEASSSADAASSALEEENAERAMAESRLAEEKLQAAEAQSQQQLEQMRSQLQAERMAKLPQRIEALLHRQQSINEELVRLQQLAGTRGAWTKGMLASVSTAADAESMLATDTNDLSVELAELPAFAFALAENGISMVELVDSLRTRDLSDDTTQLAQSVAEELQLMLVALQEQANGTQQASADSEGQASGQGSSPSQDADRDTLDPALTQLAMLKQLQLRINQQTVEANRLAEDEAATDSVSRKRYENAMRRLAERQGRLAETVGRLVEQTPAKGTEAPAEPPESDHQFDELDQQLDLLLQ